MSGFAERRQQGFGKMQSRRRGRHRPPATRVNRLIRRLVFIRVRPLDIRRQRDMTDPLQMGRDIFEIEFDQPLGGVHDIRGQAAAVKNNFIAGPDLFKRP